MKQLLFITLLFVASNTFGQTIYHDSLTNKATALIAAIDSSKLIVSPFPLKMCVWNSYDSYDSTIGAVLNYQIYTYGANAAMVYQGSISFSGSVYNNWDANSTAKTSFQFVATYLLSSKIYISFQ